MKTAWLIERKANNTPVWLQTINFGCRMWTTNACEALHFADKRTAERVIANRGLGNEWLAVEHEFVDEAKEVLR